MNIFDLVLAVIFLFYTSMGVRRGMVREVLSLVTWVFAGGLSWLFADSVGNLFRSSIGEPSVRLVVGFTILFIVSLVSGIIATKYIHKVFLRKPWLKIPNYILGGVAGALRATFIIMILVLLAGLTAVPEQKWWRGSTFAPQLETFGEKLSRYLPNDVGRHIRYN